MMDTSLRVASSLLLQDRRKLPCLHRRGGSRASSIYEIVELGRHSMEYFVEVGYAPKSKPERV